MNDDETRSAPWQQADDEPTRLTSAYPRPAQSTGHGSDDWYGASHDDSAGFGASHDADPYGQRAGYGTPAGHGSNAPYGSTPPATQPPGPQKRRGWVAPVALGVVALVSFGAVTALLSKDRSTKQAVPPVVSNSVVQSAASSGSAQTSGSAQNPSPSSGAATTTTTQPAATQQTTVQQTTGMTPSSRTTTTSAAFPPVGTTRRCLLNDGKSSTVSDPDVVQRSSNSCDFLPAVKTAVWNHESSSNDTTFDLSVLSAYREAQNRTKSPDEKEDPMVPLRCTRTDGLTNCVSNEQTNKHTIDIWVRDAS